MIESAISVLASQLNEFLKVNASVRQDFVRVSNLVEQSGTVVPDNANKIAVFLVNVAKETMPWRAPAGPSLGASRYIDSNIPLHMTLSVMFAANFSGRLYPDALRHLSNTISFFQRRPIFDHFNTPELDGRIDRLILEIENLGITELSNLWGIISGKYVPSILYRVRMVTFDPDAVISQTPVITAFDATAAAA